jgi:Protein of unknown function (DUF2795)
MATQGTKSITKIDNNDSKKDSRVIEHPPRAPSASDVEKALEGIKYPKSKEELVLYASHNYFITGGEVFKLIQSLTGRIYRNAADVARALGKIKSGTNKGNQEK